MTIQPNRFERRKQRTRRLLLDTARALLLERGYDAITVQEITDRADLGRGTFYVHFKDKEEIIWTLVQENVDELDAKIEEIAPGRPLEQRIYGIWRVTFAHFQANRDLVLVVFGKQGHIGLANRLHDYFVELMINDLRVVPAETLLPLPIDYTANYLVGAQMRIAVWWLEHAPQYTPDQIAAMFYQMTIHHLPTEG
ncbi:MAG: TetR/AcrR family transcriptional regulator [Chloroflexi bacterium]|nr:TetR/AcrR family transcriptional regulator [Chloroflexota bacterium]